jgi:GTP-binding protein
MKPTLVIVGRPNVGKSTLFNRLTRTRDALVADVPGLTRDRHYGAGRLGGRGYLVVDTGGLEPEAQGVFVEMAKQARTAIAESDAVVFVTDAREGLTSRDRAIAEELRKSGKRVLLAVNKAEGMEAQVAVAEFHELGLGAPHAISAEHGEGVGDLVEAALAGFPDESEPEEADGAVRIAIVGRPNAGKSTLVNALVGEERVVVFDQPGTTRDAMWS